MANRWKLSTDKTRCDFRDECVQQQDVDFHAQHDVEIPMAEQATHTVEKEQTTDAVPMIDSPVITTPVTVAPAYEMTRRPTYSQNSQTNELRSAYCITRTTIPVTTRHINLSFLQDEWGR